jgi:hypothetical protein
VQSISELKIEYIGVFRVVKYEINGGSRSSIPIPKEVLDKLETIYTN